MPNILFTPSENEASDRQIRRQYEAGKLLRVANGIYIETGGETAENVIRRNWFKIAGKVAPAGVVTDRTGLEKQPWRDRSTGTPQGDAYVFMSASRTRDLIKLPGLVINIREGVGPVEGDIPYLGTTLAGPVRAYLDNLTSSRSRSGPSRTTGEADVEAALENLCTMHGEEHLNHVRDVARALAPKIGKEAEFQKLSAMISTLLRSRGAKMRTKAGQARAEGHPLDPACVERLVRLANHLQSLAPVAVPDRDMTSERRAAGAFIEAYFSNFIEGTEFAVQEAVEIVFSGKVPDARPEDGHDILGLYLQLVDLSPHPATAIEPDKFIDEIKERHRQLMQARPSVRPGMFKEKPNKAGGTIFVAPDLVEGTIREGINILRVLSNPFSRALFLHFLLSDVHPFNDGNGRLSRIIMTKELVSAGLSRIVVPTIYRNDYLDALRAMSRRSEPSIFVRSMDFCQRISAACSEDSVDKAIETWARAYAFCEDGRFARLTMPNPSLVIETRQGTPAPLEYWLSIEQESAGPLKL